MKMRIYSVLLAAALSPLFMVDVGHAAAAASPTTGASTTEIRGVVKFEGQLPRPARINMAADPSCSRQHAGSISSDDIVADGNGGLENVIVFVSKGLEGKTFEPPAQPVVIQQKGCMYEPHVVAMVANQKLEVVNQDHTTHNIHPMPKNNREWNKAQSPGTPVEETFTREEVAIPVRCNIHPWMHSYIAVFKNPYFAVSGKGGAFDLKNLPAGTYTLTAWHETLGTATQTVTVGGSESPAISFVFKAKK